MKATYLRLDLCSRLSRYSLVFYMLMQLWPAPASSWPFPWFPSKKKPVEQPTDVYVDLTSSGSETSGSRVGMISRGKCSTNQSSEERLQPLLPHSGVGMTAKDDSMVWFYLPQTAEHFRGMKLVVENEEEELFVQSLPQPQRLPGIVGLTLPAAALPKKTESAHTLRLFVYCIRPTADGSTSANNIKDDRIVWDLQRLDSGETWYDDLTFLGKQQCNGTGNPAHWSQFLGLANLEIFKDSPVNCLSTAELILEPISEPTPQKSKDRSLGGGSR